MRYGILHFINPGTDMKLNNLLFYIITIGVFSLLMYFIMREGAGLEAGKVIKESSPTALTSQWDQFLDTYRHNLTHPLAILLLQIITIIVVARILGFLCRRIGQPAVIGEILAGILLGPSLVGAYFPEFSAFLFPAQSLGNLQFLSQIGLILFMFVIGMELDLKILKNRAQDAVVISHASIIFPFALGMGLAYFIYEGYAPENVKFLPFALFLGIAMSITAFPVLARIIQERGLSKTPLGTIVLTCAAADDITAWCCLAAVIAIAKAGSLLTAIYTIMLAVGYVIFMWKVVKPFFNKMGEIFSSRETLSKPIVAVFFVTLLFSAYTTEVIGIHALFGAFMAGVIMPANVNFRNSFVEKVEDVALVLLLPLFFVYTGLRTQIGLLNDPMLWGLCGLIILVAVAGKFAGSAITARFVGQSWRESLLIGALMNTRGLMELVVLNIGYDLGILSPEIFAMMVIMALVTTFMTGPALALINRFLPEKPASVIPEDIAHSARYKILISFGNPESGRSMLRLAGSLVNKSPAASHITALHLTPGNELNQFNTAEYEEESFSPITAEAQQMNMSFSPMIKPSGDIDKDIAETANLGEFDLLLIGMGSSVFEGSLLGTILGFTTKIINPDRLYDTLTGKEGLFDSAIFDERIRQIVKSTKVPVGILIEKNLAKVERVFIPIFSLSDSFLLVYAQKLIQNNGSHVVILDAGGVINHNPEMKDLIRSLEQTAPGHIALSNERKIDRAFLEQQDLMLISIESWKQAVESHSIWLSYTPSVLILKS